MTAYMHQVQFATALSDIQSEFLCAPNTPDLKHALQCRVQGLLDTFLRDGKLKLPVFVKIETTIINKDNLPMYQFEKPDSLDIVFHDADGRNVIFDWMSKDTVLASHVGPITTPESEM